MEAVAKTKNLKGSPRKARLVIDLIRGRNVSQALAILKFTDKRAADPIAKTLQSAIANATYLAEKQNIAIDPDDLFIKSCFVDMGVHKNRRRMRPAPQGRAYKEQRHYCHITILVSSDKPEEVVYVKKESAKKAAIIEKKATAKKTDEVKETKKAKVEEVETPVTAPVVVEEVKSEAEVVETAALPTVADETKPADEAQTDKNEEAENSK
jgi:large subunit ribosomal protein L22